MEHDLGIVGGACRDADRVRFHRVGVALKYFEVGPRAVFAGHVLTMAGLIAIACWLGLDSGTPGAFVAAGVLAVPVTVAFGRWTDRLLRARLQASQ